MNNWTESTTPATPSTSRRSKEFRFAGGGGNVVGHGPDSRTLGEHVRQHPYGGTACAVLNLQASWQTAERAQRIAEIFAAHADEICAEIDALDSLPDNARVVDESGGFEPEVA